MSIPVHPQAAVSFRQILISHSHRYPLWDVTDLYKLIYQAAMGAEHAVSDEAGARKWLLDEISHMGFGPEEPLLDSISPNGAVVRVHLRPFVQTKRNVETILTAFLQTALAFHGSTRQLESYGKIAIQIAKEGVFPFSAGAVAVFMEQQKEEGFPAIHHSLSFVTEYHPAYRVVARDFLPADLICMP
jgi:hypothetical protein